MLRSTKLPACLRAAKLSPLFLLIFTQTLFAGTAAETDWQVTAEMGQCRGAYVEKDVIVPSRGLIEATADSILHVEGHSTTFTGDILVRQNGRALSGDFATLDAASETFTAEGDIELRQEGLLLKGTNISGSLLADTAAVDSASFLMHQTRLRGTASSLERTSDQQLHITDGNFTTCEPDDNTWSVTGREINLKTAEGYGTARDMKLKIKDIPVAYFPYFRFPLGENRQSGFLWPSAGHDSDGGTDIAIPYYFNLAPHYDATYTLRSIWKRGVMHEGEFRFLNDYSNNTIAGTFLPSDDRYDDRTIIDSTNPEQSDQDRWLVHVNHRGRKGPWSSMLSYTNVSDIDYLEDLGGFSNTDSEFDRALDNTDAPALVRQAKLAFTRANWQSKLELRGFQSLNQVQPNQYETLPRFTLSGKKQFGQVKTEGLIQATAFDKRDDVDPEGTRIVADLGASTSFSNNWGFVTPSVRYIHRDYSLDETLPGDRDDASIGTAIASLDAGIVFDRATSFRGTEATQTLEPRIYYLYVEEEFQDDLPFFDTTRLTPTYDELFRQTRYAGYDRIGDANRIALGLSSSIYRLSDGKALISASIGQIFHFEDREVVDGDFTGNDPMADSSPLFMSLTTYLANWRFRATYEHDTEENQSNRGYFSASYRSPKNTVFNVNYAMTRENQQRGIRPRQNEETDISFIWPLGNREVWSLIGRWNYGWDTDQTIESLVGLEYNDCCWAVRVVFRRHQERPRGLVITTPGAPPQFVIDRRADSGIYVEFQLKGLGSLGGRLDNLLSNSIPGFAPGR